MENISRAGRMESTTRDTKSKENLIVCMVARFEIRFGESERSVISD